MNLNEYQAECKRTAGSREPDVQLTYCGLGIAGEAGEVADLIKKWYAHGHTLDKDKLVKELGDVLWYVAACAACIDVSLDYVAQTNVDKLRKRYPDGFSVEASINRSE